MLARFFETLRGHGVPVTLGEYLDLLRALSLRIVTLDFESFYLLARCLMVKDEGHVDRFDRAFHAWYQNVATGPIADGVVPKDWLLALTEKRLTEDELRQIEKLGGFEELLSQLAERLREQQARHEGGRRFIGTAGTSPFGAYGAHPEGVRVGGSSRLRRAAKVWEKREFRNLDDSVELGTRNFKLALRRLRRFAREGAREELDLDQTIRRTAESGGLLDLEFRAERRNVVKVLLLMDVGGSMEDHVRLSEQLFAAAKAEFRYLHSYYFHNCVYEGVWKDNRRRFDERTETEDLLRTLPRDVKVIFVGDASMNPYELIEPGGSVEHWNEEPGVAWLSRIAAYFRRVVWLNPVPERFWRETPSIGMVRRTLGRDRMFPLTLDGLGAALAALQGRADRRGRPRTSSNE